MNQTFYIDVDEEISSVISRLVSSKSKDNFFVVPKRAVFAQSLVNLKLLKREAEKYNKNITIVTQEEQAVSMAERAGIPVQESIEGMETQVQQNPPAIEKGMEEKSLRSEDTGIAAKSKKERLNFIGSESFTQDKDNNHEQQERDDSNEIRPVRVHSGHVHGSRRRMSDISPARSAGRKNVSGVSGVSLNSNSGNKDEPKPFIKPKMHPDDTPRYQQQGMDPEKEQALERIFERKQEREKVGKHESFEEDSKRETERRSRKKASENLKVSGRYGKLVFVFVLISVIILGGVGAFTLLPRADVIVHLQKQERKVDFKAEASSSFSEVDQNQRQIPLQVKEEEIEIVSTYSATGVSDSAGTKARGKVVIYNEYSAAAQPLVATTRLETEDGKIFRITEGVSVPGLTNVSGEIQPGAIEVEVIADQVGEDYNIGPTTFTIPGFKGSPRFDDFYAKSTENMKGGGVSDDASKTVSEQDLADAKKESEAGLGDKVMNKLREDVSEDMVILEDALEFEIVESVSMANEGDIKEEFDYKVIVKVSALIFSEKDINRLIESEFAKKTKGEQLAIEGIEKEYVNIEADYEDRSLEFSVLSTVLAMKPFEKDKFKADLLGRNEDEIKELLRNDYQNISNLEIALWPNFMVSSIPQREGRVLIEIVEE